METVVFDRYRLQDQIGAGGMGVVWKATDQLLRQTVALKRVPLATLGIDQAQLTRDRALREARLAAQLRGQPHVVSVYDVLIEDDDIWLVMEYLPARSLSDIVTTDGPLDPGETARIGAAIADALAAGHALGIEHRDVTPGNVLISESDTIKLTDYGISHLAGDPRLTQTGITGTPAYMAPEVASHGESSPASDVFSLGSTLYFALEGQPPFGTDENSHKMLNIVGTGIIRQPTRAGPLQPLLLRLLTLDPATRPDAATARDMLTQLATPGARSIEQRTVLSPPPPPKKQRWRPPQRTGIAIGVLLAAVVLPILIKDGLPSTIRIPSPATATPGAVPAGQSSTPTLGHSSDIPAPHNEAQVEFISPQEDTPINFGNDVKVSGTVTDLGDNTLWIWSWHQDGESFFLISGEKGISPATTKNGPWVITDQHVGNKTDRGKTITYTAVQANTECAKTLSAMPDDESFHAEEIPKGCTILPAHRSVQIK